MTEETPTPVAKRCSRCPNPRPTDDRYCRPCRAEYMREWRRTHPLGGEARMKATTRAYSKVLVRRGKLVKDPCAHCGAPEVEMHHPDYANPWLVIWLCHICHRIFHHELKAAQRAQWVADLEAAGALWASQWAKIEKAS